MRIGILSDTHDQVARTGRAVARLIDAGAEALIHCGDLTGPDIVDECAGLPAYFVLGNCDTNPGALRRAIAATGGVLLGTGGLITLADRRIAVTHGDESREIRRLLAERPDYLFTGHSHRAADEHDGPTRRINPGALHRATIWTVALLELDTDQLTMLTLDNKD